MVRVRAVPCQLERELLREDHPFYLVIRPQVVPDVGLGHSGESDEDGKGKECSISKQK